MQVHLHVPLQFWGFSVVYGIYGVALCCMHLSESVTSYGSKYFGIPRQFHFFDVSACIILSWVSQVRGGSSEIGDGMFAFGHGLEADLDGESGIGATCSIFRLKTAPTRHLRLKVLKVLKY